VDQTRKLDVVDIATFAGNEDRVFDPPNRGADKSGRSVLCCHNVTSSKGMNDKGYN
jgi:hypothetical protein